MPSSNLNLPDVSASQNQKEVTINETTELIDLAITDLESFTITSSNALVLTDAQFRENFVFDLNPSGGDPPNAQITMTVPAIRRGSFAIKNDTLENVLVQISGQSETAPIISAGQVGIVVSSGVNIRGLEAGVSSYLALSDVIPNSYVGQKGKSAVVNDAETGMDFALATVAAKLDASSFKNSHKGALLERTANQSIIDETNTTIQWQAASYDTGFSNDDNVTVQKFWLGVNLTFTANVNDNLTATAHGMTTGDGPLRVTNSGGGLPAPLAVDTNYWVILVDANTIQLATSRANAISGTQIDITTVGTGTHTLDRETRLVIPTGVTKIRMAGNIRFDDPAATGLEFAEVSFLKNELDTFDGRPESSYELIGGTATPTSFNVKSPTLEVTEGDFFEVRVFQNNESEDNAVNVLFGPFTYFSIEMVESDVVIPFPMVMVEKPFEGVLVRKTNATQTFTNNVQAKITFNDTVYDTGHNGVLFFNNANDEFDIPSGVTKVQLFGGIRGDAVTVGIQTRFQNNGADFPGQGTSDHGPSGGTEFVSIASPVLEVTAGDSLSMAALISSGSGLDILNGANDTYFGMKVVETTQVLTFPGVTVERPYIGVTLQLNASKSMASGGVLVPWDSAFRDTGYKGTNFAEFVTNPSRITIPTGISKVRFQMKTRWTSNATGTRFFRLYKNGAIAPKLIPLFAADDTAFDVFSHSLFSAVLDVVAGDYFEMEVVQNTGGGLNLDHNETWFEMDVIETDEAAFPPEEIDFFINGTPATNDMIYQKVASRRFSMADELATSQAYAVTAPSGGAVAFDVQKNAVSIGTITFADTSNTATFVTAGGSQEDFDPGDRLSVHSPANIQSMEDVSFNLFAFRT